MLSDDTNSYLRWSEQFSRERARLLGALGKITEGGIVERLEHIGATSVPGLLARPCVDIGLAVWPFPLEAQRQVALESLGYTPNSGYAGAPEQRFRHTSGEFQLFVVEPGSELWTEYRLVRDYLLHNQDARLALSAHKQANLGSAPADDPTSASHLFPPIIHAARQWWVDHVGFGPMHAVAQELREFRQPWYVSGGWALDLFLGQVSRVHQDVDVVIPRTVQLALQQYLSERGWNLMTPFEKRLELWPLHMQLEMPRHQVHAHRDGAFIDFLLTDIEHGVWRYRRAPAILRAAERMSMTENCGWPFLAPELVLLFKSKNTSGKERGKDQADFERIYTQLEPERRAWLLWALVATEPGHPWIRPLAQST